MSNAWTALLQRGVERGLLPPSVLAASPANSGHPWPLVVLSFVGALLAAIPLVAFVLLLFGSALERNVGPYVFGPLLIIATGVLLRGRRVPLFFENLALVVLLIGLGLLFFGILRDLSTAGYFVCALIALALAAIIPVNWLRSLLGALAVALCLGSALERSDKLAVWYLLLALSLLWLLALFFQSRVLVDSRHAGVAIALEWTLAGWLVQLLIAFALLAGMAFLAGGVLGGSSVGGELARAAGELNRAGECRMQERSTTQGLLAVALVGIASFWGGQRWPTLRAPIGIGLAVVLAVLSFFSPSLGPLALIGIVALVTRRPLRAAATACAAAWVIGSFYYTLCWDLVSKAQVLLAAGAALGLLAYLAGGRSLARSATVSDRPCSRAALIGIGLSVVATLTVVNVGIWQKEAIIADGRPVFIALAPVDPRSLMQGDYMALNYAMPASLRAALDKQPRAGRLLVVARVDQQQAATLVRLADATPLASGEMLISLSRQGRRWVVASDAWFFREGDGARWSAARYGEFRVLPDGQALLVGLADEKLARIVK